MIEKFPGQSVDLNKGSDEFTPRELLMEALSSIDSCSDIIVIRRDVENGDIIKTAAGPNTSRLFQLGMIELAKASVLD